MPGLPAPPDPEAIPVWLQWATAAGIMIGAAYASFRRFVAGKSAPAEPARQVVLEQASIADMAPLREVSTNVKDLGDSVKRIEEMLSSEIAQRDTEEQKSRQDAELGRKIAEEAAKAAKAAVEAAIIASVPPRITRSRRRITKPKS